MKLGKGLMNAAGAVARGISRVGDKATNSYFAPMQKADMMRRQAATRRQASAVRTKLISDSFKAKGIK